MTAAGFGVDARALEFRLFVSAFLLSGWRRHQTVSKLQLIYAIYAFRPYCATTTCVFLISIPETPSAAPNVAVPVETLRVSGGSVELRHTKKNAVENNMDNCF